MWLVFTLVETRVEGDRVFLAQLEEALQIEKTTPDTLALYCEKLNFPGVSKKYIRFDFGMLSKNPMFVAWDAAPDSGLMLLHGHSLKYNTDLFWLSMAAFQMQDFVRRRQDAVLAYHFVQTDAWMADDVEIWVVIANVIWQILKGRPHLLRKDARATRLRINVQKWNREKPDPKPFEDLLELLDDIPVTYIVLDRIDRCKGQSSKLIDRLLGLALNCKNIVKIFAVWGDGGGKEPDLSSLDNLPEGENNFFDVRLDQEKQASHTYATLSGEDSVCA